MKTLLAPAVATLAYLMLSAPSPARAHGQTDESADNVLANIAQVRRATKPFNDVQAAIGAGYAPFADKDGYCVEQPGQGAMGIHYLNNSLLDAELDPLRPEALMYQPHATGRLELAGAEYIVFQDVWDGLHPQPPVLFGHPFHLVRAPNRYNVPAFYELHLWVWEHNRNGIFNDWNLAVHCP